MLSCKFDAYIQKTYGGLLCSPRSKISDLRFSLHEMQLEYLDVSEVKVDDSFQSAEFGIENSKVKTRRDRYKSGGELIKFLKRNMN